LLLKYFLSIPHYLASMIYRELVLKFLQEKQEINGGYTGNDLTALAELLNVTPQGLRKRLSTWIKTDKEFSKFIYLGKEKPSITLFEFFKIEHGLESNPIQVKKGMYNDIQEERIAKNQELLAKTTFYRGVNQKILSMFGSDQDNWFKTKKITFPEDYSLENNRESLNTIFTFSDLKIYGGADIEGISNRLAKAKEAFSIYNVDANRYYPEILSRRKFLKKLLNSIPPNQQLEVQAKLIFQIQASYIIECYDLLIVELIHKHGRTIQSDNASRQKVENELREDALNAFRNEFKDLDDSAKIDAKDIKKHSNVLIEEEILARMKLLRKHTDAYRTILKILNDLTNNMTTGVKFQRNEVKTVYKLATGELTWDKLDEQGKKSITWKPDLSKAIDLNNEDVVPLIAINRLIEYVRKGKITFDESYYFQDIGERLRNVQLDSNDCHLTPEILDQLIACTYPINGFPQSDIPTTELEPPDDELPTKWNDLSDILREVSIYVRNSNPSWFKEHDELFKKQTDGLFWIEYTEEEYAKRLYDCIGFLGRNFRYRDSEEFFSLKYFIQRYISAETLRLEFKFIHRCLEQLSNRKIECIVLDTMGIDARIKSILSNYHGRYHTIGFADLRAVSIDMTPIFSGVCRSTDSEAMNIVEVIDEVKGICGDEVKVYTGNGHTTTKISAGMAFLSHGVIACGRYKTKTTRNLEEGSILRLKKNIILLNKIGKLLKDEPELGRVLAMRKYVYVDKVDVRKMVEDLGYLILKNVSMMEFPIDNICNAVERSNNLKKKARIVEGSRTRVEPDEAELLLKSGELILCIVGIYHLLKGWDGHGSPINLSDVRLIRPA
jgi:hypothetical protein